MHQCHLYEYLLAELKKIRFLTSGGNQAQVDKEVGYILTNAFSVEAMVDFYYRVSALTKTY